MNCQSCGMPMTQDSDHGGGRPDNVYCQYCTDEAGNLKSREDVKEGMILFYMQTMGKTREEAEAAVNAHMAQMPAWAQERPVQEAGPVSPPQTQVTEPVLPAEQPEMEIQAVPPQPTVAEPVTQAPEAPKAGVPVGPTTPTQAEE